MSLSQKEQLCRDNTSSVRCENSFLDCKDSLVKPEVNVKLFPCLSATRNSQFESNRCPLYQALCVATHTLVVIVVVLYFLVVGLVFCNVHLQTRVSRLEEKVSSIKHGQAQKSPTPEVGQQAVFPTPGSHDNVNPLMTEFISSWSGHSSRQKRNAEKCPTFSARDLLDKYCNDMKEQNTHANLLNTSQLNIALFEAVFDKAAIVAYQNNRFRTDPNCLSNETTKIKICAGYIVIYPNEGMRLHVYSSMGRNNSNIAVLEDKYFIIKTAGIYLISLNISIIDSTLKNYLGLFINNRIAMACPEGGIKCSTNHITGSNFRICNINGILKLNVDDSLDIRTMRTNTTIRIEPHSNSYFTIALLQKNNVVT